METKAKAPCLCARASLNLRGWPCGTETECCSITIILTVLKCWNSNTLCGCVSMCCTYEACTNTHQFKHSESIKNATMKIIMKQFGTDLCYTYEPAAPSIEQEGLVS